MVIHPFIGYWDSSFFFFNIISLIKNVTLLEMTQYLQTYNEQAVDRINTLLDVQNS